MLDRTYELAPLPHGDQRTGQDNHRGWECKVVAVPSDEVFDDQERTRSSVEPAAAVSRVPLRESNGLLWAWPDSSPEGAPQTANSCNFEI